MLNKTLVIYIPVIHKGFLDLLNELEGEVEDVYIIDEYLQKELSEIKPDIASISSEKVKDILEKFGYKNILILTKEKIKEIKDKEIILVQDELSRNLYNKYLKKSKVDWKSVFLRWDKEKVMANIPTENIKKSEDLFDLEMMKEAYKEAEKSSDWWRQIGAILVRDKKIVTRSYNQGVPNDNAPYQKGSIRDLFKAGENQELSPTIHAEQKLIAEAAKFGIKLDGSILYLTHFPCPVCSKLIAWSGIKRIYFSEGGSNLDGKNTMELAGVEIIHIP
ncbi:MAG: deaminase [Candidatus Nealsonbacteria bacterium]